MAAKRYAPGAILSIRRAGIRQVWLALFLSPWPQMHTKSEQAYARCDVLLSCVQPACPPGRLCGKLGVQEINGCYNYAVNDRQEPGQPLLIKTAPGDYSGGPTYRLPTIGLTCANLKSLVSRDFPSAGAWLGSPEAPCPCGTYQVALVLDEGSTRQGRDFHLLRRDASGRWSHKLGSGPATSVDAAGEPILSIGKARAHCRAFLSWRLRFKGREPTTPFRPTWTTAQQEASTTARAAACCACRGGRRSKRSR